MAKIKRSSEHSTNTESQEIIYAIRERKVDALVVAGEAGVEVVVLQSSDQTYRELFDGISEGAATLDSQGTVLYANKRIVEILNAPLETFVGRLLQSYFSSSQREELDKLIQRSIHSACQGEFTFEAASGRQRLFRFSFYPIGNSNGQNICVVATELTELLEASEALRTNEESLRQLSARLLQLQDEERRRIARDLHDTTGQKLAVQSMLLGRLENTSKELDADARSILIECKALTAQLAEEIRTVSYLLHPPLLDELGLASAVQWYTEGFSRRTGIVTDVVISPSFPRLTADVEMTLFRIVQESLTNVHRYSGSSKAFVNVKTADDQIVVEVGDYGKGMRPEMLNPQLGIVAPIGVGIQGMRERMRQLSGKLVITSQENKGTLVTAAIPISSLHMVGSRESGSDTVDVRNGAEARNSEPKRGSGLKRILVADDHEMLRKGVCTLLQSEKNWEICGQAVNGQEAVDMALGMRPDLVIIDIDMPVLNGLAAVRQILRNRPRTKILIFTVHDSDRMVQDIYAAGAHGCLSKDKGSKDLVRVVKELFETNSSSAGVRAGA